MCIRDSNTVCFFAPNTSYTAAVEYNREGTELKQLIREFNAHGIEAVSYTHLDVYKRQDRDNL